jgi:hypothetical protein
VAELPLVPLLAELPLDPEVPEVPSPPLAPSKFIIHALYVPPPVTLVGAANTNVPVIASYDMISHSWKLKASYTTMID